VDSTNDEEEDGQTIDEEEDHRVISPDVVTIIEVVVVVVATAMIEGIMVVPNTTEIETMMVDVPDLLLLDTLPGMTEDHPLHTAADLEVLSVALSIDEAVAAGE
jgi:hypothetical protein